MLIVAVGKTPPGTLLVTLDVTSLYTNIPNDEGIRAAEFALEDHRPFGKEPFNNSIIDLLRLVLTCNNFTFNGQDYLQVGGTAMGTKTSPNYAVNFMNFFENRFVYSYFIQPLYWKRYIDDIFMMWQYGRTALDAFILHLNTMHSPIKFTAEISAIKADFLDTTVYLNKDGSLWTDLFCKPTDTHSYLRYESSHPPHCKRSLPYSQFLRLRRICSREEDFTTHAQNMTLHFIGRGYPEKILNESLEKVKLLSRQTLLTPKTTPTTTPQTTGEEVTVYAITTYHPTQQDFRKIIDSNWNLLGSPGTQGLFEARIIFGHLRPKNLREHLVRAALKAPPTEADKLLLSQRAKERECASHGRCKYCPRLDTSGTIKGSSDGRKFRPRMSVTCRSNNLIYAIECTRGSDQTPVDGPDG